MYSKLRLGKGSQVECTLSKRHNERIHATVETDKTDDNKIYIKPKNTYNTLCIEKECIKRILTIK